MDASDKTWHENQVKAYRDRKPAFKQLAVVLQQVLERIAKRCAPGAIVQAREKSIASFAEKVLRKQGKYIDPIHQLTDLAGARVVTYTQADVDAVCRFIEGEDGASIWIDRENSLDTRSRLSTGEFGYRSVHYVVRLTAPRILDVEIEPGLRQLRAEIQVSTLLQHVWAAIGHDRIYKTRVRVPESLKREISRIAALLEGCDERFNTAIEGLDTYINDFDAYLSEEELAKEIALWESIRTADEKDESAMRALGRRLMAAKRWGDAARVLRGMESSGSSDALSDLGRAVGRSGDVARGRETLIKAIGLDPANAEAHAELGDSYLADDPRAAAGHYEAALSIRPNDPRFFVPYLECRLRLDRALGGLQIAHGSIQTGIEECNRRTDLGVDLPDAVFERARLQLYRDPKAPYDALNSYCKAIRISGSAESIRLELAAIDRIMADLSGVGPAVSTDELEGFVWVRALLILGIAARAAASTDAKPSVESSLDSIAAPAVAKEPFTKPVVIVAGGCSPDLAAKLQDDYGPLFEYAFADFDGTIIGGGTDCGVSGMVVRLPARGGAIRKIAYLPTAEEMPKSDREDPSYEVRRTKGRGYSPLGPIQTWADLLRAGVSPNDVRALGINGGALSAFEFRLALAMGAKAGVLTGSGRAASDITLDSDWGDEPGLAPLPDDRCTVAAFVTARHHFLSEVPDALVTEAAKVVHGNFQKEALGRRGKAPDAVLNWDALPDGFKESNRQQVAYSIFILRSAGFTVERIGRGEFAETDPARIPRYTETIEAMAEREHGRYVAERLADGWRWGEKNDAAKKTNPTLVSWTHLSDRDKEWDRVAVRNWPKILSGAGFRVV